MDPSTPLAPAPAGVVPDFYTITPLQITITVVFALTFAIATALLAARLYTGIRLTRQLGWDALLIFLSWATSLAFFILMLLAFPAGFGRNYYAVTMGQFQKYLEYLLWLAYTYIWPPTLAKLSLLIIYYRIDKNMGFPYCTHLTAVLVVVPTLVLTALFAGPCNPTTGDLQCINAIVIVQATTNIISDVVLIAMPLHMTLQLNMPRRRKITLGCLMTLGSFVVVFSIIRSAFLHTFTTDPDITYTQAYVALWSCLELNFGIICNCLAMLQPFLRAHMPRLADRIMGTSGSHNSPRRGPGDDRSPEDTLVTIGKHNVRRPWLRGDRGMHSYVLHSIDKADTREDERGGGSGGEIRVTDEFAVDVSRARTGKDDTASERRIMDDSF